jgi:hypothetical protein
MNKLLGRHAWMPAVWPVFAALLAEIPLAQSDAPRRTGAAPERPAPITGLPRTHPLPSAVPARINRQLIPA